MAMSAHDSSTPARELEPVSLRRFLLYFLVLVRLKKVPEPIVILAAGAVGLLVNRGG